MASLNQHAAAKHNCEYELLISTLDIAWAQLAAGLLFAGMGLISLMGTMPASWVADKLGRKWTIVPSCVGLSAALALMGATGACFSFTTLQLPNLCICDSMLSDLRRHGKCLTPVEDLPLSRLCLVIRTVLMPIVLFIVSVQE